MHYKDIVRSIAELPWDKAAPADLIILSRGTAIEFAASLRAAQELYKTDPRLQEMIRGELETTNMTFADYEGPGDHWQFLDYFIKKLNLTPTSERVVDAIQEYTAAVESFIPEERAMTVFSREEELTLIFKKIVTAHDWDRLGYGFYRHYLESHIHFDSGSGGHHHLTKHFPLHEAVLERFYRIRFTLYQALFS